MFKVLWDVATCPMTFDFATYLAMMDCYRQVNAPALDVAMTIRTGPFRTKTPRDQTMSEAEKRWRLKSIIMDMCELLPSIKTLRVTDQEPEEIDYPPKYKEFGFPYHAKHVLEAFHHGANPSVFRAPAYAKQMVAASRPYVTLTLRTSRHFQQRNVDLAAWYKFHQYLRATGLDVLVVPDQEDVLGGGAYKAFDWQAMLPAVFDLRLRFALYEGALMNIGSANGPVGVMFYSNAAVIQFDQYRGNVLPETYWTKASGFPAGGQYPWCRPDQRMAWKDSSYENLVDEWRILGLPGGPG